MNIEILVDDLVVRCLVDSLVVRCLVDSLVVRCLVDSLVVRCLVDGLVVRCLMDSLVVRCLVDSLVVRSLHMRSLVMHGSSDWLLGCRLRSLVMGSVLMRGLSSVVLLDVVRSLVNGLLILVMNLVMVRVVTGVAIIVVHLQGQATVLDVDLAGHEEGRVVLEAPVVTGVPLLGVEGVEVVFPAQLEVLISLIVIVNFDVVVFGVPGHLSVIEIVVPWGPAWSPEVHHQLSWVVKEVDVLLTLTLADELIVDEPCDGVRGPLNTVGEPVSAGVEASSVGVVLSAIL